MNENKPNKPGRPARDGIAADAVIVVRTTKERKSAYVRMAKPKSLSEWVTETCDAAANYPPKPPAP